MPEEDALLARSPATEPSATARASSSAAPTTCTSTSSPISRSAASTTSALARRFAELGLAGFVLKSHYVPTAERAAVVRAAVPGIDALGAITLNAGVGGLNAQAVEIAAREGARIVWLPTVDSENEASEDGPKPAKQPVWRKIQDEFAAAGVASAPVQLTEERPRARCSRSSPATTSCSRRGTSAAPRSTRAVDAALAAGVSHVVVTHPDYPTQGVPVDEQRELAERGRAARALLRADPHAARSRGSRPSRRSARPGRSTTCSRPISARSRTRRSRTGSR